MSSHLRNALMIFSKQLNLQGGHFQGFNYKGGGALAPSAPLVPTPMLHLYAYAYLNLTAGVQPLNCLLNSAHDALRFLFRHLVQNFSLSLTWFFSKLA